MAMVNQEGRLVANLSQVTKVFKTEAEYTAFTNNLTARGGNIDAFVIFKCWERPYTITAEGRTIVLADDTKTNVNLPVFAVGTKYAAGDIVTDSAKEFIYRATEDIAAAVEGDLAARFEVVSAKYALPRKAENGYIPKKGDIMVAQGAVAGHYNFYLVCEDFTAALSDENRMDNQLPEVVIDLQKPHIPEIPDFQANHPYAKHEAITYEGLLYRAREAFVSGAAFSASDFELISRVTHAIEEFVPNYHYVERELILQDNGVYAAREEFTSGATFDPADWIEIGQEDHIFFYDAAEGYPERCIVINGNDVYVTLKQVPAGTSLSDKEYFLLLSYVPQEMTQAEYDALETKPVMTIITDSVYDVVLE